MLYSIYVVRYAALKLFIGRGLLFAPCVMTCSAEAFRVRGKGQIREAAVNLGLADHDDTRLVLLVVI